MKTKEEKVREPKFYEMDGALRAYANRSLVVAGVMGLITLTAVVGYSLQPSSRSIRQERRRLSAHMVPANAEVSYPPFWPALEARVPTSTKSRPSSSSF